MGYSLKQIRYLYAIGVFKYQGGGFTKIKSNKAVDRYDDLSDSGKRVADSNARDELINAHIKKGALKENSGTMQKILYAKQADNSKELAGYRKKHAQEQHDLEKKDAVEAPKAALKAELDRKTKLEGSKPITPGKDGTVSLRGEDRANLYAHQNLTQITPDHPEYKHLMHYTDVDSEGINNTARSGSKDSTGHVAGIDRAIASAKPLPHDLILHRGVMGDFGSDLVGMHSRGELLGATLKDSGFLSTSLDPAIGEHFATFERADVSTGNAVRFRITAPKGTKGVYTGARNESELLLGRDTKMVVHKVTKGSTGITIHARLQ